MRTSRANVRFSDLVSMVLHIGYTHARTTGSHMIFTCPGRPVLTLQPIGGKAKPYQVRQVLDVIEQYGIEG
jgi:predicted RNA binding protein YcfA (HicA-like mRNA interferase family)